MANSKRCIDEKKQDLPIHWIPAPCLDTCGQDSILHVWSGKNKRKVRESQRTLFSKLAGNPVRLQSEMKIILYVSDSGCSYQSLMKPLLGKEMAKKIIEYLSH